MQLKEGQYLGEIIKSSENAFVKFNLTHNKPFDAIKKHYHENDYLSVLVNGTYSEKSVTFDCPLKTGNIIFRPLGYNHINDFGSQGGVCFNIEFKKDWHKHLGFRFNLPKQVAIYQTGAFSSIYRLLSVFLNANNSIHIYEELLLDWLFETNPNISVKSRLPWVEKVKLILENELGIFHRIESIAERVFIHPVYLSGAFKKHTGYTVGEYQMKLKLKKAIELLFNTSLPINEIAFSLGFSDSSHLINSFQLFYHTSPFQFRSKLKKLI